MADAAEIVVAGHICLDVIPAFERSTESLRAILAPGKLVRVGSAVTSTGGAVANTGLALHRLGLPVRLVARVGNDLFGSAILELLEQADASLSAGLQVVDGETTSYTVVLSPPGVDRILLHCPGANDTFDSVDIGPTTLEGARIFHFGYPPLMRRLFTDGGRSLAAIMRAAKDAGMTTSLDMALPDPDSEAGDVDWSLLLEQVLPHVDVFVPSLEEIAFMLRRRKGDWLDLVQDISASLLEMGTAIVGLKLGDRGMYMRTSHDEKRVQAASLLTEDDGSWVERELLAPCRQVSVAGTTGAGDCTVAGLLAAIARGLSLERSLQSAVAVGACSVERSDATSGVRPWEEVQDRLAARWTTLETPSLPIEWQWDDDLGIWSGPSDSIRRKSGRAEWDESRDNITG